MQNTLDGCGNQTFRLGVGGRWSARDLERFLIDILGPMGWEVCSQASAEPAGALTVRLLSGTHSGVLELVPLGDGVGFSASYLDDEELDAIVISPLADSATGDDARAARLHLARFVRQLKPGGATIFAADDPASDIFSAIRLDCRRLGYGLESRRAAFRLDRCEPVAEPMHASAFRLISPDGDGAWPISSESGDACRLALAALAAVNALGLANLSTALQNLTECLGQPAILGFPAAG